MQVDQGRYDAEKDARSLHQRLTGKSARIDALNSLEGLGIRKAQNTVEAFQLIQQNRDRASLASAHATVAAAESGVSGGAIVRMLDEYTMYEGVEDDRIMRKLQNEDLELYEEAKSVRAQWLARQYGAIGDPIARPNYWGDVMSGVSSDIKLASAAAGAGG